METLQSYGMVAFIRVVNVFDAQKILSHAIVLPVMERILLVLRTAPKTEDEKNAPVMV